MDCESRLKQRRAAGNKQMDWGVYVYHQCTFPIGLRGGCCRNKVMVTIEATQGRCCNHLASHTRGTEPSSVSIIINVLHRRVQAPEVKSSRAAIAIYKRSVGATCGTVIFVVQLKGTPQRKSMGAIKQRLTRLLGGSGVNNENALGSSFTRRGGVSPSFAFPLSLFFNFPFIFGGGRSCRLREEFDREIDGSLSTRAIDRSESTAIGCESKAVPVSMEREVSSTGVL